MTAQAGTTFDLGIGSPSLLSVGPIELVGCTPCDTYGVGYLAGYLAGTRDSLSAGIGAARALDAVTDETPAVIERDVIAYDNGAADGEALGATRGFRSGVGAARALDENFDEPSASIDRAAVARANGLDEGTQLGYADGFGHGIGAERAMGIGVDAVAADAFEAGRLEGFTSGIGSVVFVSSDSIPPTVSLVSPAEGVIASDDELVLDVADETALAYINVLVQFEHTLGTLCAYRRGSFLPPFDALSYTTTPVAGTTRLHLRHNSAWPAANTVTVLVDSVDTGGNLDA